MRPDSGIRGAACTTIATERLCQRIRAQASSAEPAIIGAAQSLDHAVLQARVRRFAGALRARGLRRNDVVALLARRDPQTLTMMLAVWWCGGACLPLDPDYPTAHLAAMLDDARPRLLIADDDAHDGLPQAPGAIWMTPTELEADTGDSCDPVAHGAPGDLAYVLFTSGSSGRPKGVAMRNAVLAHLVEWHLQHSRLGLAARTLQFAPLSFDVCFQELFSTLATGGSLILPSQGERRDPWALLALLARERVERLFVPYVALQALAEAAAAGAVVTPTLRDVITAGEQLRVTPAIRALFAALPDCVLHNHYGPTETHVVTAHELRGDPSTWPDLPPIGRALPHVVARVVDGALADVAAGDEGELLLGGDCLAGGYVGAGAAESGRFIDLDGARWYRSGDRVKDVGGGELQYLGRLDGQLKIDGYRVEPAGVEAVLMRHPAVAEVAVVAQGQAPSVRLAAYIVPRNQHADDVALAQDLREYCDAGLAAYLVPHAFVVVPALPLTPSGKIDRRALTQGDDEPELDWPVSEPLERQLAVLWQGLLGIRGIDVDANVFDLGARSLTVVRALTQLRRHGLHALSAAQIYEHPTVSGMAALLQAPHAPPPMEDTRTRAGQQRAALARFGPRTRAL